MLSVCGQWSVYWHFKRGFVGSNSSQVCTTHSRIASPPITNGHLAPLAWKVKGSLCVVLCVPLRKSNLAGPTLNLKVITLDREEWGQQKNDTAYAQAETDGEGGQREEMGY